MFQPPFLSLAFVRRSLRRRPFPAVNQHVVIRPANFKMDSLQFFDAPFPADWHDSCMGLMAQRARRLSAIPARGTCQPIESSRARHCAPRVEFPSQGRWIPARPFDGLDGAESARNGHAERQPFPAVHPRRDNSAPAPLEDGLRRGHVLRAPLRVCVRRVSDAAAGFDGRAGWAELAT